MITRWAGQGLVERWESWSSRDDLWGPGWSVGVMGPVRFYFVAATKPEALMAPVAPGVGALGALEALVAAGGCVIAIKLDPAGYGLPPTWTRIS